MISPPLVETLNDAVVTAARSSFSARGRGDRKGADQLAVSAMRKVLVASSFGFEVEVGEGEKDEAPILYVGEVLGNFDLSFDLAIDPLAGTNYVAKGQLGAVSVVACARRGGMRRLPGYYMNKCVVSQRAKGSITLFDPPDVTATKLSETLAKDRTELIVAILDKPRHRELIEMVRATGARVAEVPDGDVVATFEVLAGAYDLLLGVGGAPEGVIMAAMANPLGGEFQGRLSPLSNREREIVLDLDPSCLEVTFTAADLCTIDVFVALASVTGTSFLAPPRLTDRALVVESVIIYDGEAKVRTKS